MKSTLIAATLVSLAFLTTSSRSQDGGLLHRPVPPRLNGNLTLENASLIYRPQASAPKSRELQLHDVVTIVVDERSIMSSEGEVETRKTASLSAVLQDFPVFRGGNLKPSPQSDGDPRVQGQLNEQYRAEGDIQARDTLTFRMAAEIVDVLPNGNLVIEGHKKVRNNEETWLHSVTGIVRRESIQPDRTVKSEHILHLHIDKREMGQVRAGYRRGWLKRLYDRFAPF